MFIPFKINGEFVEKILSLYVASIALSAGSLVDIDTTDTTAITASVGFTAMKAGSVKLATVTPASNGGYAPSGAAANSIVAANFGKELGMAIPTVNATGPTLEERILELASSYMTIPEGFACAVFKPAPGDIVATDQYVGNLAGDSAATGKIDTTVTGNLGAPCGIYQGRFRLVQTTDAVRARYLGNTTANGASVAMFEFA